MDNTSGGRYWAAGREQQRSPGGHFRCKKAEPTMPRDARTTEASEATSDLSALTPDPRNARSHGERNLELIALSLQEVGAARSIVVDEDGVVLAGNATVEAARQAGIARVRVIDADGSELVAVRRSGLSPEQKRRLALLDNRTAELAEWDNDVLASLATDTDLSGLWDDGELADLLGSESAPRQILADPDAIPDVPEEAVTRPGDLWLLGSHRLLCGSCTDADAVRFLLDGKRAVLLATDPPYLVDYTGGNHPQHWAERDGKLVDTATKTWDSYREGDEALYADFLRIALAEALLPSAPVYQWHADRRRRFVEDAWAANGLLWHQTVTWVKSRPVLTRSHFMWQTEPCAYGWVEGNQPDPARRPPPNVPNAWLVDSVGREEEGEDERVEHPTQKPVELVTRPISYHTKPGELLYEPFAGSGTALIAAEVTGRVCFATELEPLYCDVVVARWEGLTGKTAERIPAALEAPDAA
jgi:DNA modification methylase